LSGSWKDAGVFAGAFGAASGMQLRFLSSEA